VESLKTALRKLELKLSETRSKSDILVAQHRRARALERASDARMKIGDGSKAAAFDRQRHKVVHAEATSQAKAELAVDDMEERLAALAKEDQVEKLLTEIKARKGLS
jgi:phage shock protein A